MCRTKLTEARPFPSGKSAYRFMLERNEVRKFPDLAPVVERDGEMVFWWGEDRSVSAPHIAEIELMLYQTACPLSDKEQ